MCSFVGLLMSFLFAKPWHLLFCPKGPTNKEIDFVWEEPSLCLGIESRKTDQRALEGSELTHVPNVSKVDPLPFYYTHTFLSVERVIGGSGVYRPASQPK